MSLPLRRVCTKHHSPIRDDRHGGLRCLEGCDHIRRWHLMQGKRVVATIAECRHKGRARHKTCPICGAPPGTDLENAESSSVEWLREPVLA